MSGLSDDTYTVMMDGHGVMILEHKINGEANVTLGSLMNAIQCNS